VGQDPINVGQDPINNVATAHGLAGLLQSTKAKITKRTQVIPLNRVCSGLKSRRREGREEGLRGPILPSVGVNQSHLPAELKDIEFIIDDTPRPDPSTANRPTPGKGSTGSGS